MLTPSRKALTSPAQALSERSQWEDTLTRIVDPRMESFLKAVAAEAIAEKTVHPAFVTDQFTATAQDIAEAFDVAPETQLTVYEMFSNSGLEYEVFETAEYLLQESKAQHLSEDDFRAVIQEGLDYDNPSIGEDLTASAVPRIIGQALARSIGRGRKWRSHAHSTARTSASGAYNETQVKRLQGEDELTHKRWVARRDDRVRETHHAADGQTVPKASLFEVGSARLLYPGQGSFPPEEIYGCRCTIVGVSAASARPR